MTHTHTSTRHVSRASVTVIAGVYHAYPRGTTPMMTTHSNMSAPLKLKAASVGDKGGSSGSGGGISLLALPQVRPPPGSVAPRRRATLSWHRMQYRSYTRVLLLRSGSFQMTTTNDHVGAWENVDAWDAFSIRVHIF